MPVKGHAGDAVGKPGGQRHVTRDVDPGRALGERRTEHRVLDLAALEPGAGDGGTHRMRPEARAFEVVEGAAIGLAERRAGGRDDDGFAHGGPFQISSTPHHSAMNSAVALVTRRKLASSTRSLKPWIASAPGP